MESSYGLPNKHSDVTIRVQRYILNDGQFDTFDKEQALELQEVFVEAENTSHRKSHQSINIIVIIINHLNYIKGVNSLNMYTITLF